MEHEFLDFVRIFWPVLEEGYDNTVEQFLILSWMIWKARNKWVFEQSTKRPSVIAGEAIVVWQEFQAICYSGSSTTQVVTGQRIILTLHWNPPCKPMYKEYFDGAVFEDLHRTGAGVIIRNEQRNVHCGNEPKRKTSYGELCGRT